jgi:hypothetical protein
MPDFLERAWEWIQQGDHLDKLIIAIITSLVVALLTWVRKGISQALARLLGQFWNRSPFRAEIARYREQLDHDALKIHHAWMKEGQTLGDILVPVSVESGRFGKGVDSFSSILITAFQIGQARHLAVTGGPGSGKSVALRLAARQTWTLPSPENVPFFIPVLLTFSEYRTAEFNLAEAVITSLNSRQFHPSKGPDQGGTAREFVQETLPQGRLVILIDALDELGISDRVTAVQKLRSELKALPQTSVIISCRTAAWHDQLRELDCIELKMEPFTPAAIRQFVRSWGFTPPKSAAELISVIESQPHVGTLARNPLMLTIIAFLYSQPKYRLPENRAQFYEVCSRALLEEWDQHENPARANQYDRPHKELLLGQLAYKHLCGPKPDEDIEESVALHLIAEGLHQLGVVRAGNTKVLDEIILNSGLLIRLPPSGLRFPHQTYLEFFAALHLLRESNSQALLDHYWKDPARWREVVLLYCGLTSDIAQSSWIVRELLQKDSIESALAALIDSRAVGREVFEEVLDSAEGKLKLDPTSDLITGLGYLSANPLSAYAEHARTILRSMLEQMAAKEVPAGLLEDLLLAVLRRPTEESARFIIEHIEELDLRRILPAMADRALVMTTKVLGEPDLALEKKLEWIDGLRRSGAVRILYSLVALDKTAPAMGAAAALGLAKNSTTEDFWQVIEDPELPDLYGTFTERRFLRWGWPFSNPSTSRGKHNILFLAFRLAEAVRLDYIAPSELESVDVDPRLAYLCFALYREMHSQRKKWPTIYGLNQYVATSTLLSHWKRLGSSRWIAWVRPKGIDEISETRVAFAVIPQSIVTIWCIIGLIFGSQTGVSRLVAIIYLSTSLLIATLLPLLPLRERFSFSIDDILPGFLMTPIVILRFIAYLSNRQFYRLYNYSASLVFLCYFLSASILSANIAFRLALAAVSMQLALLPLPGALWHPAFASIAAKRLWDRLIPVQQSSPIGPTREIGASRSEKL